VRDLILSDTPHVFMLQETWLTPANLGKFDKLFPNYFSFGCSAMNSCVETGPLRGRPYGGVMTLIHNELRASTQTIFASERCVIIKLFNAVIINVYLPCVGTCDRQIICEDLLTEIDAKLETLVGSNYTCYFGGDLNTDLDNDDYVSQLLNDFFATHNLCRCDKLFSSSKVFTYSNEALGNYSTIDYILTSDTSSVLSYYVVDRGSNLSDHLPVVATLKPDLVGYGVEQKSDKNDVKKPEVKHLRWDRADIMSYYYLTGVHLQDLLDNFNAFDQLFNADSSALNVPLYIDTVYRKLVEILRYCADATVPYHKSCYYKFWWNQELDQLKDQSISSHNAWKAAGRPRAGSIYDRYKADKMSYKLRIRQYQQRESGEYSNELHDALLQKQGPSFWKCWKSKLDCNSRRTVQQIDGSIDESEIASKFAEHFSAACTNLTTEGSTKLQQDYESRRPTYSGVPHTAEFNFDAELTGKIIADMKRGKAAGFDGLTAEHLQHSHPALPTLLAKLFNLMMEVGYVPDDFHYSYTIPLPKGNCSSVSKSLSVDDFRGISISPVLSKIFEHCILSRYMLFFCTSDNQFGFKKGSSCSHAIFTVRCVVEHYVKGGSTVNLCALDLSKAFDRMNHHGLFLALMDKMLPNKLLVILENWFTNCQTCVRWGSMFSRFFCLKCGIRQGGVLSPYLFAVFIDILVDDVRRSEIGCYIDSLCTSIFMYADDIILLAPSIDALQVLIYVCENKLRSLDMALNAKKSVCIRIGARYDVKCVNVLTLNGNILPWVNSCRYLGVTIIAARQFKCSFDSAKKSLYRSFNAVYGKIGSNASEEVVLQLIHAKCLPMLLYGLDACPVNVADTRSLEFTFTRLLMKVMKTNNIEIINDCRIAFGVDKLENLIAKRKLNFLRRYESTDSDIIRLFANVALEQRNSLHVV